MAYCYTLSQLEDLHTRAHDIRQVTAPLVSSTYAAAAGRGARVVTGPDAAPNRYATKPREAAAPGTTLVAVPVEPKEGAQQRLLTVLQNECGLGYITRKEVKDKTRRNPGLIDQAEDKIEMLQNLLSGERFNSPWLCCGAKKDVPKCACYVGRYCNCGHECYVWVMPEQMAFLREFTLAVLTLAPNEKQDISSLVPGRGAAFSPTIGR